MDFHFMSDYNDLIWDTRKREFHFFHFRHNYSIKNFYRIGHIYLQIINHYPLWS